ncbi:khg/kdpg aldolase [Luminiphilus syltensis NOR5-1B]|uniref:2-dehydro-3-deoxy-phosphogluconate aldolase n=2 Tax=Luminiphilus TaxID=1341118 RepID=B8KWX7_9GAMM|nr:khg/kdpg aldolase [Luminiphilus syltensis NOR5-1B]
MVIEHLDHAVPMAEALVAGGLTTLEITLRTDCALDAIKAISAALPDADVGAGTVCNREQFTAACEAGARFIVSPGSSAALFKASRESGVPLLPGAVTASEVMAARDAGFPVIKFFPAESSGGAAAIKSFQGPFADTLFLPTGGIGLSNLSEYLALDNVAAVGGSWVLPSSAVRAGQWAEVSKLAGEAVITANAITSQQIV